MRRSPGRVAALGVGAFLFAASASVAAEPGAGDLQTARRLFSESTVLREQGKWDEAATKLRDALAIKETPGLHFHLAHCEEKLGHLRVALAEYQRADELVRGGAKAPDVSALLGPARTTLEERIPSLRIVLSEPGAPSVVTVDGAEVPPEGLPNPLPLDPGSHDVKVTAQGRKPFLIAIVLGEGEDRVVTATLPAEAPSAPPSAPAASSSPPRAALAPRSRKDAPSAFGRELVLVGEGALALAGVGVGVVFLVQRGSASDRADTARAHIGTDPSACSTPESEGNGPCADLRTALSARHRDGVLAAGGFIAGGAFAAATVVTWLLWPESSSSQGARAAVSLVPGGATLHGVF